MESIPGQRERKSQKPYEEAATCNEIERAVELEKERSAFLKRPKWHSTARLPEIDFIGR